ncbi:hypothetical protein NL676_031063 [Syzygium grande]|nr:hypothetical protein NL676_031063 [Syzygium grande]
MASESACSVFGSSSYGDLRSRDSWPGGIWEPSTWSGPWVVPRTRRTRATSSPRRMARKEGVDEEDEDEAGDNAGGEVEAPPKRKRSDRDSSEDDGGDGGGERMMRDPPSDRPSGPARSLSEQWAYLTIFALFAAGEEKKKIAGFQLE